MLEINQVINKKDLFYNLLSLVFLGISGISINIIIGLNYEPSTLGVFNQVVTTYIIFSMIGSYGIHYSILHFISSEYKDKEKIKSIVSGGLILVLITSSITTLIYLISIYPISNFLDSNEVKEGMLLISPGLFLFSINKLLLNGVINGLNKMKLFSLIQSLRYLFILIALILASNFSIKGSCLSFVFSISEILLFIVLIIVVSNLIKWWEGGNFWVWFQNHLKFGSKSFLGGILVEMNSKVDILMIGFILSDKEVGIYSFSALFAEGFYQIFCVLQNIYNPLLSREISEGNKIKFSNIIKNNFSKSFIYFLPLGVFSSILYPYLINIITNKEEYLLSISSFIVLISGIVLASGYLPFYNIFNMCNLPGIQSFFLSSIVFINILANYILIPKFGILGAAFGTSFSMISSIIIFKYLIFKKLNMKV